LFAYLDHKAATTFSPETGQAILDTIVKGYDCFGEVLLNGGDVSSLKRYFANDPQFYYPDEIEFIEKVMGKEAAKTPGYLTAIEAKFKAFGVARRIVKETQAALKEDQKLTAEDRERIKELSYGIPLPSSAFEDNSDYFPSTEREFTWIEIKVRGNRATVIYDDMQAKQKATLKLIEGSWHIIGIDPISVHF